MKKVGIWGAVMILLSASIAFTADKADFDEVVAFEQTLKSLALSVRGEVDPPPEDTALIFDGIISGVRVIEPEEDGFRARIEVVSGEWRELEEIMLYKAYVEISGPDFFRRVPSRANREPSGGVLEANRRVVVAGSFAGETVQEEGSDEDDPPVPVVEGFYIRTIE
ncbi:MAG: hypothetical protein ACQETQ_01175 [Spirochaetota bacterium]